MIPAVGEKQKFQQKVKSFDWQNLRDCFMKSHIFIQYAKFLSSHQKVLRTLFFRCIQLVKLFHCLIVTLFFFSWLRWVFVRWAFSGCIEWGLLFVVVLGLLLAVASRAAGRRPCVRGLQQLQHVGSGAKARWLLHMGLVTLRHVEFSKPCPLHWQVGSQPLRLQGTSFLLQELRAGLGEK